MAKEYQYIIIGAGIMGLSIARTLKKKDPRCSVLILDKERHEAFHASSRNSGVLHAGFYYTADSLKAKFTIRGNHMMRNYCHDKNLPINECGKLVVAQNEEELSQLYELEQRGLKNGSVVKVIEENQALDIDPNVRTYKKALYSPDTSSIDPMKVCCALKDDLLNDNVHFAFQAKYLSRQDKVIKTTQGDFQFQKLINCAGLYADKIARDFGFSRQYTVIPFKGLYLKYTKNTTDVKVNIYPVPNLKNPFLGVHFTKTVTNEIKIGPTAIPCLWRENYEATDNFDLKEFLSTTAREVKLWLSNANNFRNLAAEEFKKYNKKYFIELASRMVQYIDPEGFSEYTKPGIRAQLVDIKTNQLVSDFVVEGDKDSLHVLNAVSPAFTCAFPFSEYIVQNHLS